MKKTIGVLGLAAVCFILGLLLQRFGFFRPPPAGSVVTYTLNVQLADKVTVYPVETPDALIEMVPAIKRDFAWTSGQSKTLLALSLYRGEQRSSEKARILPFSDTKREYKSRFEMLGRYYAHLSTAGDSKIEALELGENHPEQFGTFEELLDQVLLRLSQKTP